MRELPLLVGVALVLALLIKTFLVQAFYIPSNSMQNTLQIGDRVFVNKLAQRLGGDVSRGEVVVFRDPGGWLAPAETDDSGNPIARGIKNVFVFVGLLPSDAEQDLIKRVIGVGGDTVACCDAEGRITVNGVPLNEPYVYPGDRPSDKTFEVTIPDGRLWVMGDHRDNSEDSRKHMGDPGGGTIPESAVIGRAFVIVWPPSHAGSLSVPKTFNQKALETAAGAGAVSPFGAGLLTAIPVVYLRRRRSRRA